jgi:trehalose-6-phosphate synthase
LILSKFASAAQQLTGALIINPNDKFEVAEAIREALQMKHQERVTRWERNDRPAAGSRRLVVGGGFPHLK